MAWSFSADKPVYLQIADRIRKMVVSGEYLPGCQIPTVRQLALTAAVNPNTVQHAFVELEREGLIVSHGTVGRYVTEDADIIESCRSVMAEHIVGDFVREIGQLAISSDEAIHMIEEAMK